MLENKERAGLKDVKLHSGQTRIFQTDARFVGLIAGTGAGKSWAGPWWLAREIAKAPQGIFGVGAPTYPMLSRVTAPELIKAFRDTTLEGEYKQASHEYLLPTGGIIYLWSTDNPDHIEGGQYNAIWLDEAGQMKRWTWMVIQARLGFKQGRCLFTTTPYGLNWFYSEIYNRAKQGDVDYFVSQFASTENPYYPKAEFERARRTMDERIFAMRYLGEFRKMIGLVWPELDTWLCQPDELAEAHRKLQEAPESHRRVGGIDWGYNNPFACLSGFLDPDGVLWVDSERYVDRKLLKEHAEALEPTAEYFADPSGKQEIEEMRSLDITVNGANNDVAMGIERVMARGKRGALRISPECRNLISEGETYHYKEDSDKPIKEHDHTMDALRYLCMGIDGKAEPMVISLSYSDKDAEVLDTDTIDITSDIPGMWREF